MGLRLRLRAITWKACSTLMASFAEVSKYVMLPLAWHQASDLFCETTRESRSILLPSTTKGKLSGSRGPAWMRNSSLHLQASSSE